MKSQRRHELQHNTLDAELAATITFFRNHWSKLLLAAAVLAVAIMAIVTYTSRRSGQLADFETRYADLKDDITYRRKDTEEMIGRLRPLTEQTRVPRIAALACVDIGNLHAAAMKVADDDHFKQASKHYDRVITDFSDQNAAVAKAHFGLARLAESAGNFDAARKHYDAIKNIPGQPVSDIAQAGGASLKDLLTKKVHLATTRPASPDLPEPATAPADSPGPATAPATQPE